jgi:hypothetical protein
MSVAFAANRHVDVLGGNTTLNAKKEPGFPKLQREHRIHYLDCLCLAPRSRDQRLYVTALR